MAALDATPYMLIICAHSCFLTLNLEPFVPCSPSQPDNVLLKRDHSNPYGLVAKLMDFGLSQRMDPGRTHVSNNFNGTP